MIAIAAALALATPAVQAAPPAPASEIALDPARVAAAKKVIDHVWPIGTTERLMKGSVDQMMDAAMSSALGLSVAQAAELAGEPVKEGDADITLGEAVHSADPHFEERYRLASKVMMDELTAVLGQMEPAVREGMTGVYARHFTLQELQDLDIFFQSPTGGKYARDAMALTQDPELVKALSAYVPMLMEAMPDIMKKVEAATAHLPPPPKPESEEPAFEDEILPAEEIETEEKVS